MLEHLVVPVEWKATTDLTITPALTRCLEARKVKADEGQYLEGYASTFGNVDLGGDVVVKGAFTKTIANIKANGIPLLADHMPTVQSVLGTIFDAKQDAHGLKIKALFSTAPSAQDAYIKGTEGHLSKMSIGYEPMDYAYEDREGMRVRLLKEIKLWECSVVVFPMNPEAVIDRVKGWLALADDEARDTLTRELKTQVTDLAELRVPVPLLAAPETATAAPSHNTATAEGEWDAGANVGRLPSPMPVGTARRVYALYDSSAVEDGAIVKGACSLPHHFVSGDGTPGAASVNGVRNALARLGQVQGYSEADISAAQTHLRNHLDAANTDSLPDEGQHKAAPDDGAATGTPDEGGQREPNPDSPTGAEPVSQPGEGDQGAPRWDRWASAAVMAGHDPTAVISAAERAGLETRLSLLDADLERLAQPDTTAGSQTRTVWEGTLAELEKDIERHGQNPD